MAEIVTQEMINRAWVAYTAGSASMKAALLAVAPLIRRAALEEAAAYLGRLAAQYETAALTYRIADDVAFLRARATGYTQDAAAILALAEKQP